VTRPTLWRATRLLVATVVYAVIPQPSLRTLRHAVPALRRNLRQPSRRKRKFQELPALS
jgi:hypothetical protein